MLTILQWRDRGAVEIQVKPTKQLTCCKGKSEYPKSCNSCLMVLEYPVNHGLKRRLNNPTLSEHSIRKLAKGENLCVYYFALLLADKFHHQRTRFDKI